MIRENVEEGRNMRKAKTVALSKPHEKPTWNDSTKNNVVILH
jgi:hypothetical protein